MTDPQIHFLVPYLGRFDYLRECVASVVAQDDPRWLLTVIEDGDQGFAVSNWLSDLSDTRVRHLLNREPLGIGRNFQRCLDEAEAPWVVILGCDDQLLPGYVATMLRTQAESPQASIIQPGVEVIDDAGVAVLPLADRVKRWLRPRAGQGLQGESALVSLMGGNWTYFPSLCWRTDAVRPHGFRDDLPTTLDLELLCRVLAAGHTLQLVPDVVFRYRRHDASASSATAKDLGRFDEEAALFRELADRFLDVGWQRASRAARVRPTSRLHAATFLPPTLWSGDAARARRILSHLASF